MAPLVAGSGRATDCRFTMSTFYRLTDGQERSLAGSVSVSSLWGGQNQEMANWAPQEKRSFARWIGELFRARSEDATHEHQPERWVDLIQYLNEQEREREQAKRRRRAQDHPH